MTFHSASLRLAFIAAVGLATAGCQSMAVAMDDPLAYDPGATQPAGFNAYCSTTARDAAVQGTLPLTWCAPTVLPHTGPGRFPAIPIMAGEHGAPGEGHPVITRGVMRAGTGTGDSVPADSAPAEAAAERCWNAQDQAAESIAEQISGLISSERKPIFARPTTCYAPRQRLHAGVYFNIIVMETNDAVLLA